MNNKNKGQIIIPGLFFLVIIILFIIIIFNTSQEEYEKQQATNIADAAVFSTLSYEANRMNYLAYTNRAIITNQIAVGQLMAVASWSDYAAEATQILANATSAIPLLSQATRAYAFVLNNNQHMQQVLVPAYLKMTDSVIKALTVTQSAIKKMTLTELPLVATRSIELNDERFKLSDYGLAQLALHTWHWSQFTSLKESEGDLNSQADFINSMRDDWTRARNLDFNIPLLSSLTGLKLKKRGSTQLVKSYDTNGRPQWSWESRDNIALQQRKFSGFRLKTIETPLLGKDYATNSEAYRGYLTDNRKTERMYMKNIQDYSSSYSGLKGLHELNDKSSLILALEVEINSDKLALTQQNNSIVFGQKKNTDYSSIAKGELFFQRSFENAQGQQEYANLYNPFWSAHLIDASAEKKQAWALKGYLRPF